MCRAGDAFECRVNAAEPACLSCVDGRACFFDLLSTALVLSSRWVPDTFCLYSSQYPLAMKKNIHPDYKKLTVHLADGAKFETRSTMASDVHKSEVDSTNHPFYTGRRQYVDTAGRVEKFRRRYGVKQDEQA